MAHGAEHRGFDEWLLRKQERAEATGDAEKLEVVEFARLTNELARRLEEKLFFYRLACLALLAISGATVLWRVA